MKLSILHHSKAGWYPTFNILPPEARALGSKVVVTGALDTGIVVRKATMDDSGANVYKLSGGTRDRPTRELRLPTRYLGAIVPEGVAPSQFVKPEWENGEMRFGPFQNDSFTWHLGQKRVRRVAPRKSAISVVKLPAVVQGSHEAVVDLTKLAEAVRVVNAALRADPHICASLVDGQLKLMLEI